MSRLGRFIAQWVTLMLVATLLVACGGKEERKAAYMERGKAYIEEQNYDKASIEFRNVVQIDPKAAEAVYYIGFIAEQQNNWRKAFNHYQRAFKLDETLVEPRVQLARIYMAQAGALQARGDLTGKANAVALAQEHITEILTAEPENTEARTLAAVMLNDQGETEQALAQLEEIVSENPGQLSAVAVLSRMYEDAGLIEKAEKIFKEALINKDDRSAIQLNLARFYARQKNFDSMELLLRQMIAENPNDDLYKDVLVRALVTNDRVDDAEQELRDYIKSDPDNSQRYLKLSAFLVSQRSEDVARSELEAIVEKKPELADVGFALAGMYLANKETDLARKVLEAIVERHGLKPIALKARLALAQIFLSEDSNSLRGKELLETVLKENPSDNAALLLSGKMAGVRKDYVSAIADFRAVLKDQPNSGEVLILLATAHLANNEPNLAHDTLTTGVEKNPSDTKLRMALVGVLIRENDLEKALREIDKILEIDKFNDKALAVKFKLLAQKGDVAGLDQVTEQMQTGAPDDEVGFFREVQVRVAQKDYSAAQEILDNVLNKNPDSIPALVALSHVLEKLKKYDEGLVIVRRLQVLLPESGEGNFREAKLLDKKGDLEGALKQYEIAYGIQPDSVDILLATAELEIKMDKRAEAEKRLINILVDNPEHKSANNILGLLYLSEGRLEDAGKAFEAQIKIAPNSRAAYAQLASTRISQGDLDGAVRAYQDGLAQFEHDVLMMVGFAGVRERQGFHEDAIALYERILDEEPGNAVSTNNLASLLSDYRTDKKSLGRAIELAKTLERTSQPAFRDTAGWVYYRQGEYQKAVEILSRVVQERPKLPVFNYHLGMAYFKAGDNASAKVHLKRATGKNAIYSQVEEARALLESL